MSAKRDSPSAQRNKQVILDVLQTKAISDTSRSNGPLRILEIAAGSGVHTDFFSRELAATVNGRAVVWFPTDPTEDSLASIECYIRDGLLSQYGVQPALPLTLNEAGIQEASTASTLFDSGDSLDLMICINMIHISPWTATLGLIKLASERLSDDGTLYCYGPYKEGGTAVESNL